MKTRFENRFPETPESLIKREWVEDISIDDQIKEIQSFIVPYKENYSPFFVEFYYKHHFYCGCSTPAMDYGNEVDDFEKMLSFARAGDIIEIWTLTPKPKYYKLHCPDKEGRFPRKRAY